MSSWKKFLLIGSGFGAAFAMVAAVLIAAWIWYEDRPHPPKPWNSKAIIATYDHVEIEANPDDKDGSRPRRFVFLYTVENTSDFDYRIPQTDQYNLTLKLEEQNGMASVDSGLTLDDTPIFVPAKQRMIVRIHLLMKMDDDFGPEVSVEDRRKRQKAIAGYMSVNAANLDGFALFDMEKRYRIDFPAGWKQTK